MSKIKNYKIKVYIITPKTCNLGCVHGGICDWKDLTNTAGELITFTKREAERYVEIYGTRSAGCLAIHEIKNHD